MKNQVSTSLKSADTMSFRKSLKGVLIILSTMIISLMHLSFAFAKTNSENRVSLHPVISSSTFSIESSSVPDWLIPFPDDNDNTDLSAAGVVYDSLHLDDEGLSREAFDYATEGWQKLIDQGEVTNSSIMAIADFSQSSTHKRLYVLDMKNYKVLFNTLVSHGKNSGKEWATSFSNQLSSYKSSPGFYVTGDTYMGSNGYSLRLNGVEKGINDNALDRAIVLHGADYVSQASINAMGYIGRSWGCPAVPVEYARPIINTLKDGACLFVYTSNQRYLLRSSLI